MNSWPSLSSSDIVAMWSSARSASVLGATGSGVGGRVGCGVGVIVEVVWTRVGEAWATRGCEPRVEDGEDRFALKPAVTSKAKRAVRTAMRWLRWWWRLRPAQPLIASFLALL